jgi:hypothetical protein
VVAVEVVVAGQEVDMMGKFADFVVFVCYQAGAVGHATILILVSALGLWH